MVQMGGKDNETFAVPNLKIREVLEIDGNRLVGVVGQAIDRMFIKFAKRR